jgi:hypothetical protein
MASEAAEDNLPSPKLEEDLSRPVAGYPSIARKMGEFPDLAAFRRFRALNAKNLLYYQAELIVLELKLHQEEIEGNRLHPDKAYGLTDWRFLKLANEQQWETVKEIRTLLKEYSR